ncbi:hypothetical protein TorRG33x02_216180, partial [Trema orientale]
IITWQMTELTYGLHHLNDCGLQLKVDSVDSQPPNAKTKTFKDRDCEVPQRSSVVLVSYSFLRVDCLVPLSSERRRKHCA